ncbi:TPA: hypothetical protein HA231_03835 [Candidatus Woesearchaeota archaeon]|nr:hypothetical protein [Candidatus Woesearchaeota archaeon]
MENKREMTKELKILAACFAAFAIALKLAYYREGTLTALKTAAALYWLFVIPGYAMMLHWRNRLGLAERMAMGTVAAIALTGIASYYIGLAGLKLQNQTLILPLAIIAASFLAYLKFSARKTQQQQ